MARSIAPWAPEPWAYDLDFAQGRLRILSGLYGLLHPLDLIQPYRLEMGLRWAPDTQGNLYTYWEDDLAHALARRRWNTDRQLGESGIRQGREAGSTRPVITSHFKEERDGGFKTSEPTPSTPVD